MTTLQHSLITLFAHGANMKKFEDEVPYVLLPDAIRMYAIPRQYSHFEQTDDGSHVNWIKYPRRYKKLKKERCYCSTFENRSNRK